MWSMCGLMLRFRLSGGSGSRKLLWGLLLCYQYTIDRNLVLIDTYY